MVLVYQLSQSHQLLALTQSLEKQSGQSGEFCPQGVTIPWNLSGDNIHHATCKAYPKKIILYNSRTSKLDSFPANVVPRYYPGEYTPLSFTNTRRYSLLCGFTSSSCRGLWPSVRAFLLFGPKKELFTLFVLVLGQFWCNFEE